MNNVEVFCNYELQNFTERKREFHIVKKNIANGFEIMVVIECKNYKKSVLFQ